MGQCPLLRGRKRDRGLLREVNSYQGVAVMAHPSRRQAWQKYQREWAPLLLGMEQWNRKVDGVAPSQEGSALLKQNPGLLPFAGLDFHGAKQFFPLAMVCQNGGRLNEDHVLNSLRRRKGQAKIAGVSIEQFSKGPLYRTVKRIEHLRQQLRRIVKRKQRTPSKKQN